MRLRDLSLPSIADSATLGPIELNILVATMYAAAGRAERRRRTRDVMVELVISAPHPPSLGIYTIAVEAVGTPRGRRYQEIESRSALMRKPR